MAEKSTPPLANPASACGPAFRAHEPFLPSFPTFRAMFFSRLSEAYQPRARRSHSSASIQIWGPGCPCPFPLGLRAGPPAPLHAVVPPGLRCLQSHLHPTGLGHQLVLTFIRFLGLAYPMTTDLICHLTVLEARDPKSKCQRGHTRPKALREDLPLPLLTFGDFRHSLACGRRSPVSAPFSRGLCFLFCLW